MKRIILIFLLISGCSSNQTDNINKFSNLNFSNDLSFEEFKIRLENYASSSPYPNIDN